MKNCCRRETRIVNNDTWIIYYLRLDESTVKITCDLLRPNRRFWQSKELFSDWTYCTLKNANLIETFADSIINDYYERKRQIDTFDKFFEKAY